MDNEARQMHRRALVVAAVGILFGGLGQASLIGASVSAASRIRADAAVTAPEPVSILDVGGQAQACAAERSRLRPDRPVVAAQSHAVEVADRDAAAQSN